MIKVKMFPVLAQQSRSGRSEVEVEYQPGMVAGDILRHEGFEGDDASVIIIVVNNEQADLEQPLRDGDQVELMMPIEGG